MAGEVVELQVTTEEVAIGITETSVELVVVGQMGPPGPPGADGEQGPPVYVDDDPPPDPEVGQLWFDTDDPHTADAVVTISATAPTLPDGSLWFDTGTAALFVRYLGAWVGV